MPGLAPESEPEPVAAKKTNKRSPESIAKQKATLARKKRSKARSKVPPGTKAAFVRANPTVAAPELVKLAAKQGIKLTASHVYSLRSAAKLSAPPAHGPSSNAASIGELLETIADAALEIKRRLSQLTL